MPRISATSTRSLLIWRLLWMAIIFSPFLQAQEPYAIHFDEEDGLPSSEVYGMEEDANGLLWFVTDRGMVSYNGYEFRKAPFHHWTQEMGLTFLGIDQLPDSTIVLFASRGGLGFLKNGKLQVHENEPIQGTEYKNRLIAHFTQSKSGLYYFSLPDHDRVFQLDTSNGQVVHRMLPELDTQHIPGLPEDLVVSLPEPETKWIHSKESGRYLRHFLVTHKVADDHWIFCTNNTTRGNFIFEIVNDSVRNTYQSESFVRTPYFDRQGDLWITTYDGLLRFAEGDLRRTPDHYLHGISILDMLQDREGNYWACTQRKGVYLIPNFNLLTPNSDILKNREPVTSVDTLDSLLVFQRHQTEMVVQFPSGNSVRNVVGKGESAWTNSLQHVSPNPKRLCNVNYFSPLTFDGPGLPKGLDVEAAGCRLENGDRFDLHFKELRIVRNHQVFLEDDAINLDDRILSIRQQQNKRIWLGCLESLYVIDNYDYTNWQDYGKRYPQLQSRISDLEILDQRGQTLWISTIGKGVSLLLPDTCITLSEQDGLSSNLVQCLFRDGDSVLWAGTTNGLNKIRYSLRSQELRIHSIEAYGLEAGIPASRINAITRWQGSMWLATNHGLIAIDSRELRPRTASPIAILEQVKAGDLSVSPENHTAFAADQRDLKFQFYGISLHKPFREDFYRYRLQKTNGKPTPWSYTNDRAVQFMNLERGHYTFTLQAQNNFGIWSEKPVVYTFSIAPRLDETWWFRGLGLLLIVFIIGAIFTLRFNLVRRDLRSKLQMRDAELRLLRTQMSPHFIFNLLNGIQQLIFGSEPEQASLHISKLAQLMRSNLKFSKQPYITLREEVNFLESYLLLEQFRFGDRVHYKITLHEDLEFAVSSLMIPPFLIQPLLENAIKHGLSNIERDGLLTLDIYEEEHHLKLIIEDNGRGWPEGQNPERTPPDHALSILRDRLRLLNLEWPDQPATVSIIDRKSAGAAQSGVRITLHLPRLSQQRIVHLKPAIVQL